MVMARNSLNSLLRHTKKSKKLYGSSSVYNSHMFNIASLLRLMGPAFTFKWPLDVYAVVDEPHFNKIREIEKDKVSRFYYHL